MDIVTLAAARKSGGSGGDVTKDYVDTHLALKVDKIEGKGLSTNDYTDAEKTKVANSPISTSASGASFALTDAADAPLAGLVIEGRTTSSGGVITNVGDNGTLTITSTNGTATKTAALTTGLPLCSVGDVKDTADFGKGIVTKRTKIENNEVVALTTPVELAMTAQELAEYHNLRTFENTTNITCTDFPQMVLDYMIDTENGASIGQVTENIAGFINSLAFVWNTPEMHRMIFRGKYLGDHVTTTQLAAIRDGSFDDLYIGDYWTIANVNWRVADMDYWWGCGDTAFNSHHLVIVPDARLYNATMNDTNITTGGYVGSKMYTENLTQAKTKINSSFPNLVLTHREYLVNAVTNGKASGGAWYNSTVELMNENMIYGHREFTPGNDGTTVPANYTIDKTQLALFALAPTFITNRANYWLRDVVSAEAFAIVHDDGGAASFGASYPFVVRPVFAIG